MAVKKVIVLGGGSAGFMAALALKSKLPALDVLVIRSKDIGIIGVGEGSTGALVTFLHNYLGVGLKKFHQTAQPVWKMGLHFQWGKRPWFHYQFGPGMEARLPDLPKTLGYYCDEDVADAEIYSAMMSRNRVFERTPNGGIKFHNAFSYHFENEKFVTFLEEFAIGRGVRTLDDTVVEVKQNDAGVSGLVLKSGQTETADLYVDASGFISLLLNKTLGEPFIDYKSALFCNRAVVGGWDRGADEPIQPYTVCETMNSGWCWRIDHIGRINRGYVYSSDFISDEEAEREFREKNPKLTKTRIVKFVTGRYERGWIKNVIAIGNSSGFVEPLQATALGVIAIQSGLIAEALAEADLQPRAAQQNRYNDFHARNWDSIRDFLAMHYRYNDRIDTPFWRAAQNDVPLGRAQAIVDFYREVGPSNLWWETLFDPFDQFKMNGYAAVLVGMKVPYQRSHTPSAAELSRWETKRAATKAAAERALTTEQALALINSPKWKWT